MSLLQQRRRLRLGFGLLLVSLPAPALVNCGASGDAAPDSDAGTQHVIPESGAAPVTVVDASCDAGDACAPPPLTCEAADFCTVDAPVDPRATLTAIWGTSNDRVWAVGSAGTVIRYDGATWAAFPSGVGATIQAIWSRGPDDLWLVGWGNIIRGAVGAGAVPVWRIDPLPELYTGAPHTVVGCGPGLTFLAGDSYGYSAVAVQKYVGPTEETDGGLEWRVAGWHSSSSETLGVNAIWCSPSDELWVVGSSNPSRSGATLHAKATSTLGDEYEPDVLIWNETDSQTTSSLNAVWGSSDDDIWAVGKNGTIRHLRSGDARWEVVASPTTNHLNAVSGTGPLDVWAVGEGGTILHFDGRAWSVKTAALPSTLPAPPNLRGVWASSPDDVWIAGDVLLHLRTSTGGK